MANGLIDADLGGHVVKKRVALPGRGKRGSLRTLVAFRLEEKAFFIYGFAKNERANISQKELKALKLLAEQLLSYTHAALVKAVTAGELIFAAYLNTSPSTVQKWEQGQKKPNGPSLKLLNLVDKKGLEALAW